MNVEVTLHPWGETKFVLIDDVDVLLNLVCKYLLKFFYPTMGVGLQFCVLIWFGVTLALQDARRCYFLFNLMAQREFWVSSSVKGCLYSAVSMPSPSLFLWEDFPLLLQLCGFLKVSLRCLYILLLFNFSR